MGLLHSRPYIIFKPKSMWQRVANVKTIYKNKIKL